MIFFSDEISVLVSYSCNKMYNRRNLKRVGLFGPKVEGVESTTDRKMRCQEWLSLQEAWELFPHNASIRKHGVMVTGAQLIFSVYSVRQPSSQG